MRTSLIFRGFALPAVQHRLGGAPLPPLPDAGGCPERGIETLALGVILRCNNGKHGRPEKLGGPPGRFVRIDDLKKPFNP